jgi:hypothetical protein
MVPQANASVAHNEMRQAALRIGVLSVLEDIAHTSHRSNQRMLSYSVYFAAQPVNMHINHIRVRLDAHTPNLIQNH